MGGIEGSGGVAVVGQELSAILKEVGENMVKAFGDLLDRAPGKKSAAANGDAAEEFSIPVTQNMATALRQLLRIQRDILSPQQIQLLVKHAGASFDLAVAQSYHVKEATLELLCTLLHEHCPAQLDAVWEIVCKQVVTTLSKVESKSLLTPALRVASELARVAVRSQADHSISAFTLFQSAQTQMDSADTEQVSALF